MDLAVDGVGRLDDFLGVSDIAAHRSAERDDEPGRRVEVLRGMGCP